jgi:hypothetical protein
VRLRAESGLIRLRIKAESVGTWKLDLRVCFLLGKLAWRVQLGEEDEDGVGLAGRGGLCVGLSWASGGKERGPEQAEAVG